MGDFTLWPHSEVYPYALELDRYADDIVFDFCKRWLDKMGGYDYGAMNAWLMRAFGLPNVMGYDGYKHGFNWALLTPDGYVITVEPKPLRISVEEYSQAGDKHGQDGEMIRNDLVRRLAYSGTFSLNKIKEDAGEIDEAMMDRWLEQFRRPVYIRDVGATVLGPIYDTAWADDVGPGDDSVLSGGARQVNSPVAPNKPRRSSP